MQLYVRQVDGILANINAGAQANRNQADITA